MVFTAPEAPMRRCPAEGVLLSVNFLNLPLAIFHAPEYVGCEPVDRSTWVSLYVYCAEQENGGVIQGCKSWSDRRWQQTCQVTLEEVNRPSPLWVWADQNLTVWRYDTEDEKRAQAIKAGALKGNMLRWSNRHGIRLPNSPAKSPPESAPESAPESSINQSISTEYKGVPTGTPTQDVNNKPAVFKKPTQAELEFHAAKIGLPATEVANFLNHYESNGWKVGPNKMRSWPHAMNKWKTIWESRRGSGQQMRFNSPNI